MSTVERVEGTSFLLPISTSRYQFMRVKMCSCYLLTKYWSLPSWLATCPEMNTILERVLMEVSLPDYRMCFDCVKTVQQINLVRKSECCQRWCFDCRKTVQGINLVRKNECCQWRCFDCAKTVLSTVCVEVTVPNDCVLTVWEPPRKSTLCCAWNWTWPVILFWQCENCTRDQPYIMDKSMCSVMCELYTLGAASEWVYCYLRRAEREES